MPAKFDLDFTKIDWMQFHWKMALRRIPAIVLLLSAALWLGQPAAGVLAAGAALSVGFGAGRQVLGSRLLAMIFTTLSVATMAFAGTVMGNFYPAVILGAAAGGFACGSLALFSEDLGWIVMQGVIAFLIGSSFASNLDYALERSACILTGSAVQTFAIWLIWTLQGIGRFGPETEPSKTDGEALPLAGLWRRFRESAFFSLTTVRYGVRVGITLVLALELDHLLQLKNGYWLPMTTLVVMKPDFYKTYTGGVQRVTGTLAGVLVATLIAAILRPQHAVLISLVGGLGFATYAFQKANAVIFSAALTAYIVFMIALTGLPEASVTWHRFINTALGCTLALTSHIIGYFLLHPTIHLLDKAPAHNLKSAR